MPAPAPARPAPRTALLIVLAAWLAAAVLLAATFPLADPDEGRNAEVMREMIETRDPVIPHLAGMPYLDKPPALFWAGAAALAALGRSPFAARVPAILAALATLLLLARARQRVGGPGSAVATVALAASAPLFLAMGSYVIFDMPLTACVTAFWTLLAVELEHGARPARRVAMFAAIGVGLLVKGPVMLAWAIGGSAAGALLLRSRAPLAWLAWAPGWLVALGLAGGWFALALQRHPEYAHYAFVEESLERMTTGSFQREQPFWFAPAVLVGGALPWSLVTPWRAPASRSARLAAGMVAFALVFFTISHSKLVTYLLPAMPALAWWAADAWAAAGRSRQPGLRLAPALAVLAIVLVTLALRGAGREAPPGSPLSFALLGGGLASALLLPFAVGGAILPAPGLALGAACAWAPLVFGLSGLPLARHAAGTSGAPLAGALRGAGADTWTYLNCYSPGTDFLLGRRGTIVSATGTEITSNYVVRYRDRLRAAGLWTPIDPDSARPPADVVVRPARRAAADPATPFFVDRRFTATRASSAGLVAR